MLPLSEKNRLKRKIEPHLTLVTTVEISTVLDVCASECLFYAQNALWLKLFANKPCVTAEKLTLEHAKTVFRKEWYET